MNSRDIQRSLWTKFKNQDYKLSNVFFFGWECDFFTVSKSNYISEIEIKISKSDFKADFNKEVKRGLLKHDILVDEKYTYKPNKFYFAAPKGLIDISDIPREYGLIEVANNRTRLIREAKFLHKENLMTKIKFTKILLDKFYYRNVDLRHILKIRDYDIKHSQKRIFE